MFHIYADEQKIIMKNIYTASPSSIFWESTVSDIVSK
jgi:hypothetical protein